MDSIPQREIRNVWMVSREYDGVAGAGGVKDVTRQLAEELVRSGGVSVSVVMPCYGFLHPQEMGFEQLEFPGSLPGSSRTTFFVDMNYPGHDRRESVSVWKRTNKGVHLYLLEADRFREKLGVYTYTAEEAERSSWQKQGMGHYDYFAMNVLLQKATLDLMILLQEVPDCIHCQDGHAAILPAMMRENEGYRHYFHACGAVVTIHNAGLGYHQEVDDLDFARAVTGLPEQVVRQSLLRKSFDPFLAAADYAVLNAVSANYARELRETSEDIRTGWLGHHLKDRGVLLEGVTNGINPADFDPRKPKALGLEEAFDPEKGQLEGKLQCKKSLLAKLGNRIARNGVNQYGFPGGSPFLPLFTFIGRLTTQKGVDLLEDSLDFLLDQDPDFQVLILGTGTPEIEERLITLAEHLKGGGRVCFLQGYDPELALKIYAAGDFFLIPSLYEPCGLTDYIAQLLGNLPIVHSVGGLVKVVDNETGFAYQRHEPEALVEAMQRALDLFRTAPEKVRTMQGNAVKRIRERHTWKAVMRQYLNLYQKSLTMLI